MKYQFKPVILNIVKNPVFYDQIAGSLAMLRMTVKCVLKS